MRFESFLPLGGVAAIVVACGGGVSLGNTGSGVTGTDGGDGSSSGGSGSGAAKECASKADCGPAPASPALQCSDGSIGGNTGRCIQTAEGKCAWEMRDCPPAAEACFDGAGNLDPKYKKCATAADCVTAEYTTDCCGNSHVAGVASGSAAAVKACIAAQTNGFPPTPACECPAGPPKADDGTQGAGSDTPAVSCNASSQCETTFKTIPCGTTTCAATDVCCNGVGPVADPKCYPAGSPCPL